MKTTADRIKEGMEIRGLRQADLVEKTGISKGALSSYISGRYIPKQNNIFLIAKVLNVNEAWLMGYDVPMERNNNAILGDKIEVDLDAEEIRLNQKEERDIAKALSEFMNRLESQEGLMIDGNPASPEAIDSIISAMQIGMEMAKKKNSKNYTPKKFRKE